MRKRPYDEFVSADSTPLYLEATGSKAVCHLLWGDGVRRLGEARGGRVRIRARGRTGWAEAGRLGGSSLLELYFIDVGQGDGTLIKTPDFRHILVDGGHPRKSQNTGKSAADFVDWKFAKDYGAKAIELDAMIASHNDYDHYGGLGDLLDATQEAELDAETVSIAAFYHGGISWWKGAKGRTLGATRSRNGAKYYVDLLGDRTSAERAVAAGGSGPRLQGAWAEFISRVVAATTQDGMPSPIARLGHQSGFLPGFAAGGAEPSIRVLGPVEATVSGKPALSKFKSESTTTNGNSIVLRLDYGRVRVLLTGDLNTESQHLLLKSFTGARMEFQCDVAKGCHHGSDDVSVAFLQAMAPAATIISSGDAEGHDHPRPRIVAASGATGHLTIEDDKILTPLVYSTELARSVSLGSPTAIRFKDADGTGRTLDGERLAASTIEYSETQPGALQPRKRSRRLKGACIVAGLIYGLVNVRTDGDTILLATMNEGDASWSLKKFRSRF